MAAWVVVYHHCVQVFYGFNVDGFLLSALAKYGSIGVDLFFVISGFVIYYSVIGKEVSPLKFAVNRAIRILPVYWIFTLATAVCIVFLPGIVPLTGYDPIFLLKSLLFVPEENPSGIGYFPILTVGWTLNYEMAFYAIFTIALLFKRKYLIAMLVLGVTALESLLYKLGGDFIFYRNAMVYEFLFGVFAAVLYRKGWLKLNPYLAIGLIAARAVFILMSDGVTHGPVKYGLPCVAIVGFLSLENFFKGDNFLMRLGDWSYSTYLCHVLIISFVFYVSKSYADTAFIVWLVLISMLVVALSWMSYSYIERPFVNRLKGLQSRQVVSETV